MNALQQLTDTMKRINEETQVTAEHAVTIGAICWFRKSGRGYDPRQMYVVWR